MKTETEIRDWLLENAVSEFGDLQLSGLDFGDFDGDVLIGEMFVKRNLYQNRQTVKGYLYQSDQTVKGDLHQRRQTVGDDLYQSDQHVGGYLYQCEQTVGGDLYQHSQTVGGGRHEDPQPTNIAIEENVFKLSGDYSNIATEAKDSPNDLINSPNHYIGDNGLEVEQILREFLPRIKDAYVAHRIGSAIEYILRSPLKNGVQDYQKAIKNLEQALEHLGSDEE